MKFNSLGEAEAYFSQRGFTVTDRSLTNYTMQSRSGKKTTVVFINRIEPGNVSATIQKFAH